MPASFLPPRYNSSGRQRTINLIQISRKGMHAFDADNNVATCSGRVVSKGRVYFTLLAGPVEWFLFDFEILALSKTVT